MMVDRRTWDRKDGSGFSSFLVERGWASVAWDFRGHGDSGPLPGDGGSWGYDDIVGFDIPTMIAASRARHPGLPVLVCGHSLGGHTSIAAAGAGLHAVPPDAHLLLATNTWMPSDEPDPRRRWRKATSLLTFVSIARAFGRFPSRMLRMGPAEEPLPYVRDLRRFWTRDAWTSRDGALDYRALQARVQGPVVSLIGEGDDLMAHPVGAERWAARVGAAGADFRVVADAATGYRPDHMGILTEARSRRFWAQALGSIEARLGV
jgi:predicted alpha/beta hydrolase